MYVCIYAVCGHYCIAKTIKTIILKSSLPFFYPPPFFISLLSHVENFLEDGSLSAEQPANSLPRTGSFGKGARLGVAFDPSAGPGPEEGSKVRLVMEVLYNWTSKASPTLGYSIEILHDIYIYIYVGLSQGNPYKKYVSKMRGWIRGPNTRMLKVSFGRLKPTCDTRIIHFYYTLEQL